MELSSTFLLVILVCLMAAVSVAGCIYCALALWSCCAWCCPRIQRPWLEVEVEEPVEDDESQQVVVQTFQSTLIENSRIKVASDIGRVIVKVKESNLEAELREVDRMYQENRNLPKEEWLEFCIIICGDEPFLESDI